MEKEFDIGGHDLLVGTMQRDLEDFMEQAMVDDHADKCPRSQQRIDLPEGALLNPGPNVSGEIIVKHPVLFAEEHIRELVAFQGAEEQQSEHRRIGAGANAIAGDERKNSIVIPLSGQLFDGAEELAERGFLGEDRCVQGSFGWKVLEHQGFADAGGTGDFLGRGALKALLREQGGGG